MIVIACALLSGAMFYFAHGLDNVWALAWIAPLPLLWLAYGDTPRWQIFVASVAAFATGQFYMVQAYGGDLPWIALLLMMFGTGALFAFAIGRARLVQQRFSPLVALFAFPAIWTALEFLASLVSPHGSFGALAYSQVSWPPAIQIAALFGLTAITFLLCLFANALALMARGARGAGLLGVGICILALAFGYQRLAQPQRGDTVSVALLADWGGRLKTTRKLDMAATRAMAVTYAATARQQAARGARVIVIPETALAADPRWRSAALQPLADVAREKQVTIVAGVILVKPWRNAALAFLPDGSIRDYDKRHLLLPGEGRFMPGSRSGPLGHGQSVAICKDLDFPRTLRRDAQESDIRLMAVPANDFRKDNWIHARMAVMRGVENGFAVARSAFNGLETVSDARGRILASSNTDKDGMIVTTAHVVPGPGPTLYTRIGDVFAWLCVAITLCLIAMTFRTRRGPA